MPASRNWKVLDLGRDINQQLLVKSRFESSGYQIGLTDLSRIWREEVTKAEIVQRASDSGSSIDPGQDDEQYDIFLSKIQSALDHEDGTSLDLATQEVDESTLVVKVSAALPHPLPPFTWSIYLRLLEPQQLENELITPLLVQSERLQHQIEQLVHELQDKDRVISKICDRVETSGNDLTTVFPGVSNIKTSRKKGQREQLGRHVKGLADFDESSWRERNRIQSSSAELETAELNTVLSDLPQPAAKRANLNVDDKWWKYLSTRPPEDVTSKRTVSAKANASRTVSVPVVDRDETMQDSDFQRQPTPPRLRKSTSPDRSQIISATPAVVDQSDREPEADRTSHRDDGSTTEDESDDLDAGPSKPEAMKQGTLVSRRQANISPSPPPRRLGAIGGHSPQPQNQHLSKSPSAPPRKLGAIGGRSPQPPAALASKELTPDIEPLSPKPRSKLGTIGGRAKASTPAAVDSEGDKPAQSGSSRHSKIGIIGGKKARDPSPMTESLEEPHPPASAAEQAPRRARTPAKKATPAPRETSRERADRKREQLKRELEAKAKAPVKKKRKF
ncbi:hypothetical protein LTR37_013048 [Vermiconidia calcicola]|uniref:Uncharacterized protein n=1 Tax=Vermiconidia calcicola TaxID=1690605 RepID=A0ACC3MZ30_9PEZI|nr:hypothetical protein LTR37_013048 [Vermiconidia calcicola]